MMALMSLVMARFHFFKGEFLNFLDLGSWDPSPGKSSAGATKKDSSDFRGAISTFPGPEKRWRSIIFGSIEKMNKQ